MRFLRYRLLSIFVLAMSVFALACATPEAQTWPSSRAEPLPPPALPSSFYGTVEINGQDVPAGTLITVGSGGIIYAQTTSFMYEGSSVYTINVPGDRPETLEREGGTEGEALEFTVAGLPTHQTAIWHSASNQEHPLVGTTEEYSLKVSQALVHLPFIMRAR